jgi:hypothetical protein
MLLWELKQFTKKHIVPLVESVVECTREHGQLTVSKNLIPNSSASACPFAVGTAWQNAICRLASHRVEGVNCDAVSGLFSKYKKHPTNLYVQKQ